MLKAGCSFERSHSEAVTPAPANLHKLCHNKKTDKNQSVALFSTAACKIYRQIDSIVGSRITDWHGAMAGLSLNAKMPTTQAVMFKRCMALRRAALSLRLSPAKPAAIQGDCMKESSLNVL